VVGVGHWHFSSESGYLWLARLCGLELVGVCDDQQSIAQPWADEIGCGWTLDVDDLVSRYAPDVVIALPRPDRALEQVGRLLDRGIPLIAAWRLCRRNVAAPPVSLICGYGHGRTELRSQHLQ
jgi:predicted dehydrogenase